MRICVLLDVSRYFTGRLCSPSHIQWCYSLKSQVSKEASAQLKEGRATHRVDFSFRHPSFWPPCTLLRIEMDIKWRSITSKFIWCWNKGDSKIVNKESYGCNFSFVSICHPLVFVFTLILPTHTHAANHVCCSFRQPKGCAVVQSINHRCEYQTLWLCRPKDGWVISQLIILQVCHYLIRPGDVALESVAYCACHDVPQWRMYLSGLIKAGGVNPKVLCWLPPLWWCLTIAVRVEYE